MSRNVLAARGLPGTPMQQVATGDSMMYGRGLPNTDRPYTQTTPQADPDFYTQLGQVQDKLASYRSVVDGLAAAQKRKLRARDPDRAEAAAQETEALRKRTSKETKALRTLLAELNETNKTTSSGVDFESRRQQIASAQATFKQTLQYLAQCEKELSSESKDRLRRQVLLVNPGASEEEVRMAVDGGQQVFAQTLVQSRSAAARTALTAVEDRQRDILALEQTMLEVAQVIGEINDLVLTQDAQVVQIEASAAAVERDTQGAERQIQGAVTKARGRRKLKICCAVTMVIVIVVIVIVLVVNLN